jgi:hypothetical protein
MERMEWQVARIFLNAGPRARMEPIVETVVTRYGWENIKQQAVRVRALYDGWDNALDDVGMALCSEK